MKISILCCILLVTAIVFNSCKSDSNPMDPAAILSTPALVFPANKANTIEVSPTFRWSAQGAKSYILQISVDQQFGNSTYFQAGLLSTSQIVRDLKPFITYYWHVKATNDIDTTDWSDTWSFITSGAPPSTPYSLSPESGAEVPGLPIVFSWKCNPGSTAPNYRIQISKDSTFSKLYYEEKGFTTTSHQSSLDFPSGTYFWRVTSSNKYGESEWTSTTSFSTINFSCGVTPTRYLGKTYATVKIGNQCWLKENLNVGTRVNGAETQTDNNIIEKYCYDDADSNCAKYGGLYQWDEAMNFSTSEGARGICPFGWHIPTQTEMQALEASVNNDGNALKEIGQGIDSGAGTNTSGFSALLSGYRFYSGTIGALGRVGIFWSSTQSSIGIQLNNTTPNVNAITYVIKQAGYSIRCIKD